MTARSRELANQLARNAIAAAERRREAEGASEDAAERLRQAADEDGRLSVDDALGAVAGERRKPWNPFEGYGARQAEKGLAARVRLFGPEPEPKEPDGKPSGDADGGKGDPPPAVEYESVQTEHGMERMRVFDINNLDNPPETEEKAT